MQRWNLIKSLIAAAALVGPLAASAQNLGDCPGAALQTHAVHAVREIGVEQAARFGLTLPCRRLTAQATQESERRQMLAEMEAELARRRAEGGRDGFRPERYGLALPSAPVRAVRVATTAGYDVLNQRAERLESGG